ncbi:ABC transporter permease [Salininema proteolyticum]|uniref:Transport permease protein n=1 Tax=Salininema proteolyticum TaxID=1607685 RepID=A0ABV8U6A1_9ACTN
MSTKAHPIRDSATMLRRNLVHIKRYPSMTIPLLATPVLLLVLFVYVFGSTMGDGLPGASGGRADYLAYVVPGIMLMTAGTVAQGTTISVSKDMTEGIVARFRTMSISRGSILTGHVLGSTIQVVAGIAVILGVAALMGYRTEAVGLDWLGVLGSTALVGFALAWITTAMGVISKTLEMAGTIPIPLMFLPMLGSGFVPTDTMPTGLRWFAEYQPFTPMTESLRGFLTGHPDTAATWATVAWCAGLALIGYLWSRAKFESASTVA